MQKPDFLSDEDFDRICQEAMCHAEKAKRDNLKHTEELDLFQLADLYLTIMLEKLEKEIYTDSLIDYNDEIVEIEEVGDMETIDITVTGDNLFYCSNILTKNSVGLPYTLDAFFALITSEELEAMGQMVVKQLKNRWGSITDNRKFVIGIDKPKMRLYNVETQAQNNIQHERAAEESSRASFKTKKKFDTNGLS